MNLADVRLEVRQRGLDARWVTPAQAAELLPLLDPQHILGATFCEQDGAISPPRNVAAYLVLMREHGVRLREQRQMESKEKIGKLSVKMTIVMMLTLLPALMIVLAGPAIIALAGTLTRMGGQ